MSKFTEELLKQLRFISTASMQFMYPKQSQMVGQQRVLAILDEEDGLIQSQLAEILDLRPSSLAELLKKMENGGDIVRQEDEADKRLKRVFLTEQGRQKAAALPKDLEDRSAEFFAGLTETEQEKLKDYFEKIMNGWDDSFQTKAADFMDPFDRLKTMQNFRRYFENIDTAEGRQPTPQEIRERKRVVKEMKQQWKKMVHFRGQPFDSQRPPFPHEFMAYMDCEDLEQAGRSFDKGSFQHNHRSNHQYKSKNDDYQQQNDTHSEEEWHDF